MRKKIFLSLYLMLSFFYVFAADSNPSFDLISESEKSGIVLYYDTLSSSGFMEKNGHHISFRVGDNILLLDSQLMVITNAPSITDGKLFVSKNFLDTAEDFFKQENAIENYKIGAILIDPGHGGKDPGAMMKHKINGKQVTVTEKDITLAVGKQVFSRLKTAYPDKQIILTRNKDIFLTLQQRTEIANSVSLKEKEAVLYISVHVNASLDKKATGYEVWYLTPGYRRTVIDSKDADNDPKLFPILNSMMEEEYTTESILIAKFIMDGLQAQIGELSSPRGIKAEEWFVVRNSNMPSVLVELGFLTNYKEACLLNDNAYLQKTALGIYNGISAFVTHFERSKGFTGLK